MRNFNDDIIWGYGKHPNKWYSGTTGVWGRKYQDDREKMKQQSDEILQTSNPRSLSVPYYLNPANYHDLIFTIRLF